MERTYRRIHGGLTFTTIAHKESDIHVGAPESAAGAVAELAKRALAEIRAPLEAYAAARPEFAAALAPLSEAQYMPAIVREMCRAAKAAGVGPMAAVAGAVNDFLAEALFNLTDELILENGGDILIRTLIPRNILVYAGASPLSNKLGIRVAPGTWGVCTSSGTVGHALSFGKADAALVLTCGDSGASRGSGPALRGSGSASRSAPHIGPCALSDACATALGNRISAPCDIEPALNWALSIPGVFGALAIVGGAFGAMGGVELVRFP